MLPTQKMGVLYTDNFYENEYHIMTANSNHHYDNGEIHRCVLKTDRTGRAENYEVLYWWMHKLGINRLWIHPETLLSTWAMRNDFMLIKKTPDNHILNWSSPEKLLDGHPKGLRMYYMGDTTRWLFFPAHMELVRAERKHQQNHGVATWFTPSYDNLYHSVEYLERATDNPFLWGPAYSSKMVLRNLHHGLDIFPFGGAEEGTFKEAYPHMVIRPLWVHRNKNKKRGIPEKWKVDGPVIYVHGLDKNLQYLGAATSLSLPNQVYGTDVAGSEYSRDSVGFWEYELLDVGGSMFNSYDCYCPLEKKRNWASTSVINFAMDAGIRLMVHRGYVFDKSTCKRYLDEWAHLLYHAKVSLQDNTRYPDAIAVQNAKDSLRKYYVDMIGQFCAEYSDEYTHKDWNTFIVHEAISRQGYTLLYRQKELHGNILLVVNDSFYLLSYEADPYKAFPSLLKHEKELRGYKLIGTCKLTPDMQDIIADEHTAPAQVETFIKKEMQQYATIR